MRKIDSYLSHFFIARGKMMKNNKKAINTILLLAFISLGLMVRNTSDGTLVDIKILEFIHSTSRPMVLEFMKMISYLGTEKFIIPLMIITIAIMIIRKTIGQAIFLLVNTLGSFILNFLIKEVFQRSRPFDFFLVEQGGLSYPSGHAMVVMSMYLAIFHLVTRKIRDGNKKVFIGACIGVYISLMGISRLYLGVHWPTDIVGGYILGYLLYDISKKILRE